MTHFFVRAMQVAEELRNPEKVAQKLAKAGIDISLAEAVSAALRKRDRRCLAKVGRYGAPIGVDTLVKLRQKRMQKAVALREARAAEALKNNVHKAAVTLGWRSDRAAQIFLWAEHGTDMPWLIEDAARAATLEAVARECRKRGWEIRHTSKGRDGKVSSRYVTVTGRGEVRVSDHDLPETQERFERQINGFGKRWSGEVVVSDWEDARLLTYIRRIFVASGKRKTS